MEDAALEDAVLDEAPEDAIVVGPAVGPVGDTAPGARAGTSGPGLGSIRWPGVGVPLAGDRLLTVAPPLVPLLPDGGLRRGSVLSVTGDGGATSLMAALVAGAMAEGSWVGVVGLPALGLEAADRLGLRLDHLALVPEPGAHWAEVVAALVDSLDVVAVVPTGRCRPADARRLTARARERGAVLVVAGSRSRSAWPEPVDLRLEAGPAAWYGLGAGHGTLVRRYVTVRSSGRRAGARERRTDLWLPAGDGRLAPGDGPVAVAGAVPGTDAGPETAKAG